jgi:hypothetical protein
MHLPNRKGLALIGPSTAACSIGSSARIFSGPPVPPCKSRWQHLQYDLVQFDDGTIGFIRNAFQVDMARMLVEVLEELFGLDPAKDRH